MQRLSTLSCLRRSLLQTRLAFLSTCPTPTPIHTAKSRAFTVLALESSADDTCAAIVTSDRRVLSNVVIKQHQLHGPTGGIYPPTAIDAHQRNMPHAVRRALQEAKMTMHDVDGIAFTRGPGIGGCLSVGSNAAKSLAAALDKPLVGVHHMQAHALTSLLTAPSASTTPRFPFLTLLVSGGHTLSVLATSLTSFRILGTTADESVGRSFDKVARILGLEWGKRGLGAALEDFCEAEPTTDEGKCDGEISSFAFPHPMRGRLDFSFASLHSTVDRHLALLGRPPTLAEKRALAREFQDAAVAQLCAKLRLALDACAQRGVTVGDVVVSGGVASNRYLRTRLRESLDAYAALSESTTEDARIELAFPPVELCTDNAAMIGWAAMHRFLAGDYDPYDIDLKPKWSIEEI
ncbi:peptidase M22 glycoprotease [Coniophora puteana RWD-64-598 SS2]|uniref:N(6)-L-threonylcarbamoyladenine synthase n=1 Tax=Coniophora puteana (strain RWD-64-598) TaxID=741705 RepID=R7SEC2_CONPW|nr:peptidase M22 glycoprotease [Coniophora puteana RWD-64-598 SS2]EIW74528.1 peptidase M22 glycoprotease [Coniophora puteana RWD-64-598 SS2]